jgi:2-dehydro-3-deoxyphosphooctonate aldolase (KDO 8-P synthase)
MITDRGTMFGYQDMIVDYRENLTMQQFGTTVLDVTHHYNNPTNGWSNRWKT